MPGAAAYDLVRGDLALLRASGGDFAQAGLQCMADNHGATSLAYSDTPPAGAGFWFLVRGDSGAQVKTWDSFAMSQVGLRDDEIQVGAGCP